MTHTSPTDATTVPSTGWLAFPGGELEGRPSLALCDRCRAAKRSGQPRPLQRSALCFQCYRADLAVARRLRERVEVHTGSAERFQDALPFEPVDTSRLARLKRRRAAALAAPRTTVERCVESRVKAQMDARHALAAVVSGLRARGLYRPASERAIERVG